MALANRETSAELQQAKQQQRHGVRQPAVISILLGALSCIGMLVSLWMIFLYAPTDAVQGMAQRILYFHVPFSWVGMLAYVVLAVAGIAYLFTKNERYDWIARAASESGTVFITLALVTGSIWGKTAWGTWWAWDAKLTATLILWFMFVAYVMLRSYMGRTRTSAYFGAALGIIGVVDVPIIYLSVSWWRTLHPVQEVGAQGALPSSVTLTLMMAFVTFTLLYSFLMVQLYQLERLQSLAQRLRATVEYEIEE